MKVTKGQQIKTKYGDWEKVINQIDNVIYVWNNNTVHTSNVITVK